MSQPNTTANAEGAAATQPVFIKEPPAQSAQMNRLRFLFGLLAVGVGLFFGLNYLAENWSRVSTDDAFIDGHVVPIASKVPGEVVALDVKENEAVKAGDLLVEIDARDYDARAKQKHAAYDSARANQHAFLAGFDLMRARVNTAESTRKESEAEEQAAKARYDIAEADWGRASNMWLNLTRGTISQQDYEAARATMTSAKATWLANQDKVISEGSRVVEARAQLDATEKLYEGAGAQVELAQADSRTVDLELSYTKIRAPVDGRITRKIVEKGAYVQTGQALFAIVEPEVWVTANFKETQTAKIHPGQPVAIEVDGMGKTFRGHVDSLQSGSGARFSLLPPENAVGNYVKVVQRVPVKIVFDDPLTASEGLGPGMSVTPSVQIGPRIISTAAVVAITVALVMLLGGAWWFWPRASKAQPAS